MTNVKAIEAQLTELQEKFAFQQETIDSLNETVTAQWAAIDKLTHQALHLKNQMNAIEDGQGEVENTRPPHY